MKNYIFKISERLLIPSEYGARRNWRHEYVVVQMEDIRSYMSNDKMKELKQKVWEQHTRGMNFRRVNRSEYQIQYVGDAETYVI